MTIAPQVFILRGLSGSGKSTLARQLKGSLHGRTVIISADDYFQQSGEYCFDPEKLAVAHRQCYERFVELVDSHQYSVIVDNTNSKLWHYAKFYYLARAGNLPVTTLEIPCLDMATVYFYHSRSRHQVPLYVMRRMYFSWEHDSRATLVLNPFSYIKKMKQMTA